MTLILQLIDRAGTFPGKTAVTCEGQSLSYGELLLRSGALARYLLAVGLARGDRVALFMQRKTPDLVTAFLGITAAGGIAVPIDCAQPETRISHLLGLTEPRALILSDPMEGLGQGPGGPGFPCLPPQAVLVMGQERAHAFTDFETALAGAPGSGLPAVTLEGADPAYLNLTSGTTGMPKCAVTTHDILLANTLASVKALGLGPDDVHLCMFPPSTHPHELFARSLYLGGTAVLTNTIAPRTLTEVIETFHVTCMMAIAPIYGNLVRHHARTDFRFTSLRVAESGGMHLDSVTARSFLERFGFPIVPVWGSTETAGIALAMPLDQPFRKSSCGKACPGYEARVVDKNGRDLPAGEVGELIVRGDGVCREYFRNGEETRRHFRDGWYWTGDMFRRDADGYFLFSGRQKGMMKVAGMKVSPVEIEELLLEHPLVREVGVTRLPDPTFGDIPKAVIVPEPGAVLDRKEIRSFLAGKLAPYKIPKVIEFRESLPRTPGGKIIADRL
jgi:acyl-CoA synthetase (AMP-forming)/AMP-acid ligase II